MAVFANEISQIIYSVWNGLQYIPNDELLGYSGVWTKTFSTDSSRVDILPRTIKQDFLRRPSSTAAS